MISFFRIFFDWAFGGSDPAPAAVHEPPAAPRQVAGPPSPADVELNLKLQALVAQGAGVKFYFGFSTEGPHAVAAAGYAHGCLCWMELWPELEPELRIIKGVNLREYDQGLNIMAEYMLRGSLFPLQNTAEAESAEWIKWCATGAALRELAEAQVCQYLATMPVPTPTAVSTGNAMSNAEWEGHFRKS